jgi:PAS domain S-box-containing protein
VILAVGLLLLAAGFQIGHEIRARGAAEARVTTQAEALATAVSERDDANLSLRANQARFQAVMDHTPMMVSLKDLDGRYTFANRAFQDYLGREADQILGKCATDLRPRQFAEETVTHDKAVVESKRASQREVVDPDGGRSSLVVKFPVIEDNGEVSAVGTIMVDISELKRVQSALAHAQKMEALGQLTGGIAHDFNNLLTAILLNSDVLASRVENESLRTLAVAMRGAADRGADLTRRLLAFGRQQALEPKPTDVNDLMLRMEPLMHRTLGEHIDIRFVRADDLWLAQVDPGQLENAVLNLAVNARDAMPERGRLTIETGNVELDETSTNLEAKPGDYVMVAVGDTGSGMPPEVLAHVFEPFFTTKEVGRGTGLGLSMVYGFVKQSEGHIQVYSEIGVGTVVKLYLPRAHAAEVALEPATTPTELPSGREVILLVEDDALVRAHTEHQLIALGYHVITAEHAGEAMQLLRDGLSPDLLFTDMVMPGGMNGRELGEEARKLLPGLKVLYTTGYAGAQSVSLATDALPSAYLLGKPYRRRDLATKVRAVLDERAAS